MMLPAIRGVQEDRAADPGEKRAAEALLDGADRDLPDQPEMPTRTAAIEIDASRTASAQERLRSLDFEQMSTAEMAAAKRMLARLTPAGETAEIAPHQGRPPGPPARLARARCVRRCARAARSRGCR